MADKARKFGVREIEVWIKGPGSGRESAVRALMVIGERGTEPYRDLFVELADVGTDDAARIVLELYADERLRFDGRDDVFGTALRILLDRPAVDETRGDVEALRARLGG